MDNIDELRRQIRIIDEEMKELFLMRCNYAKKIGIYKAKKGLPVYVSEQEKTNIKELAEDIQDPVLKEIYRRFLQYVMDLAKKVQ